MGTENAGGVAPVGTERDGAAVDDVEGTAASPCGVSEGRASAVEAWRRDPAWRRAWRRRLGAPTASATLCRRPFEGWVRWGVRLGVSRRQWMRLGPSAKGSLATESAELKRCQGMVLVEVDGVRTDDPGLVADAIDGKLRTMLRFCPYKGDCPYVSGMGDDKADVCEPRRVVLKRPRGA
eukprot:gene6861-55923_t